MGRPALQNRYWVIGGVALIDVSTKRHPRAIAMVDATDLPIILDGHGRWSARRTTRLGVYAGRTRGAVNERIHSTLLGSRGLSIGDHKNGDTLDNRRRNLRHATSQQNNWNSGSRAGTTSRFKGVSFHKATGLWQAQIQNGGNQYLGVFPTEEQAARAYDAAACKCHGEFARPNFPQGA